MSQVKTAYDWAGTTAGAICEFSHVSILAFSPLLEPSNGTG